VISRLQQRSKLGNAAPSDQVESLRFEVRWEPTRGVLGVLIPVEDAALPENVLIIVCVKRPKPISFQCFQLWTQDADNLDFEALLRTVIEKHIWMILKMFQSQLQSGPTSTVFSPAGVVSLVKEGIYLKSPLTCESS